MVMDPPRTWLLLGDKRGRQRAGRGDRAGARLALRAQHPGDAGALEGRQARVAASLHHVDLDRSDPLEPPWPDLVITIGRRPSMAALWVAEQSGGRTRLVLVGKPSGKSERFDLVVIGAEAQMPPLANLLRDHAAADAGDAAAIEAAARAWAPRLGTCRGRWSAFLIGGPTGPFVFDRGVVRRLLELAAGVAAAGGTPYFTTSRRTPPRSCGARRAPAERGPAVPLAARARDNPYLGLLGLADGLVVTGDSISMMVEIIRLRRPLAIFDLPTSGLGQLSTTCAGHWLIWCSRRRRDAPGLRRRLGAGPLRLGSVGYMRDFGRLLRDAVPSRAWPCRPANRSRRRRARCRTTSRSVVAGIRELMGIDSGRRLTVAGTP